ncbi:MAG: hypothetical protein IH865_03045 [Chloroflexi bacterium]|nr:hypothetical protein [Chloroflexota bacterium]
MARNLRINSRWQWIVVVMTAAGLIATVAAFIWVMLAATAASAGGSGTFTAYVTNEFSNDVSAVAISGRGGTETEIARIPVGTRPIGIVARPDGQKVYVGNSDSNSVSVIDTGSNTVIKTITGIDNPMGEMVASQDGSRVYVGSGSNHIFEIDTATDTVVTSFSQAFHGPPVGLALSQDGQFLYATSSWAPTSGISKIRLSDKAFVATRSGPPIQNNGPIGLTLYHNDERLLVAMCGFSFDFNKDVCNGAGPVPFVELNASDLSVRRTLTDPAFGALNAIEVTDDETRAYVIDSTHGDVIHVIDLVSFTRVAGVPMGSHPRAITKASFGPGKEFLYAADSDHAWLAKIDANPTTATYNTVVGTTPVGTYPRGVAIANTHRPEAHIISVDDTSCPLRAEMEIFDDEGHPLSGTVNLSALRNPFPNGITEIRLEILHTRCSGTDRMQFFFGDMASGTLIDDFEQGVPQPGQTAPLPCTCDPGVETRVYTDPNILALYNTSDGEVNQFHVHRESTGSFNTAVAWVRIVLAGPDLQSETICVFDFDGGDCGQTNLCSADFTAGTIHEDAFVESVPTVILSEPYSDSRLSSSLSLSGLAAGVYTLELTATDGDASSRDEVVFNYDGVCRSLIINPPTSIEVRKTADSDGRFVSGTISITNVGENPAQISAIADSLEVHFPRRFTPPPLPEGSTRNWFKVADVPVENRVRIPVGETVSIDYTFDLCDAADFSGASSMRNVVAVTLANKPEGAQNDTVVTRSDSFQPTEPDCHVIP